MKKAAARNSGAMVTGILARSLVLVWLAPAVAINCDWTATGRLDWNIAAIGSIAMAAVLFEAVRHAKGRAVFALLILAGSAFFVANVSNGFRNAVTRSGDSSDHRRGEIEAAQRAADTRARLTSQRIEAVAVAGERLAADYRGQIETLKTADAKRWQATRGCDASGGITLAESQAFCAGIADIRRKLESAERRDAVDGQLAALDLRREAVNPPASADPFADNLAALASGLGLTIGAGSVRAFFDFFWAIVPEIIAATGPALCLWLFDAYQAPKNSRSQTVKTEAKREEGQGDASPLAVSDVFARFAAEMLEASPGARLSPKDALALWRAWNASNGREPESQKWLGARLGRLYDSEEKHKRKHYLNVRAKRHAPNLRIVSAA